MESNCKLKAVTGIKAFALSAGTLLGCMFSGTVQGAIDIVFDYTYDTQGFFTSNPQAVARLEEAAVFYEAIIQDSLDAIVPGEVFNEGTPFEFSNSWTASFSHPGTGDTQQVVDATIPQDQILVYAGGRELGSSTLGRGGPGGFSSFGLSSWNTAVRTRGEGDTSGATADEFGPWGGSITFDTSTNWHFGATDSGLAFNEFDFLSVAVHELGHVLGFGTSDSFENLVVETAPGSGEYIFQGLASFIENGGADPEIDPVSLSHWIENLNNNGSEVSMDPTITAGDRKLFTRLDYAALDDLGWDINYDIIPTPSTALFLAVLPLGLISRRRQAA